MIINNRSSVEIVLNEALGSLSLFLSVVIVLEPFLGFVEEKVVFINIDRIFDSLNDPI